jgi:hypothetical protein
VCYPCAVMRWKEFLLLLVVLVGWTAGARTTSLPDLDDYAADDVPPHLATGLITTFSYHGTGVGAGAFFFWPVLPRGFIPEPVRDAVLVGGGLHFCYWSWRQEQSNRTLMLFAPAVGLRYLAYSFETVALTLDVRLGPAFSLAENYRQGTGFFWYAGGGALWDLADFLALNVEFGWGSNRDSLRLGLNFWF